MLNVNDLIMRINVNNYQYYNDGNFIDIEDKIKFIIRDNFALLYQIDSWICEGDEDKVNYKDIGEPLFNQSIKILQDIGYNSCDLFDDHLIFNFDNFTSNSISINNLSNEIFEKFSSFIGECNNPIIEEDVYNIENEDLYRWFNFANDKFSYLIRDEDIDEKGFVASYLKCSLLCENFVDSGFAINRRNRKNNNETEFSITESDNASKTIKLNKEEANEIKRNRGLVNLKLGAANFKNRAILD